MKTIFYTFAFLVFSLVSTAQSSKGFSFQGYARGLDGAALQNVDNLEVRLSIYSTDENNPEFMEEQTLSTDEFGVFQTVVGIVNSNDFNVLNFATQDYTLKVELKDAGEWQAVVKQSLLAVPYAKAAENAKKAESVADGGNGVPAGSIMPFAGTAIPQGWLLCDGRSISRNTYAKLFQVIGESWGQGNNTSTFNVPDLRGTFLRGVNGGANDVYKDTQAGSRVARKTGGNTGNQVGSYQDDAFPSHNHAVSTRAAGNHFHGYYDYYWVDAGNVSAYSTPGGDEVGQRTQVYRNTAASGSHTHVIDQSNRGSGTETRPANANVNYIIKY